MATGTTSTSTSTPAAADAPLEPMSKYWWIYFLQGIATIGLALLLIFWPRPTLVILVTFLGVYWLAAGIIHLVGAFRGGRDRNWGWMLTTGILGIVAGAIVLTRPLIAALLIPTLLIIIVGINGVLIGTVGLVQAFRGGGWGPGLWGAISAIFGLLLLFNPLIAAALLPWVLAIFALFGGLTLIVMSLQIRPKT